VSDMEMMKKRFSKLLLGEDMSGVTKFFFQVVLSLSRLLEVFDARKSGLLTQGLLLFILCPVVRIRLKRLGLLLGLRIRKTRILLRKFETTIDAEQAYDEAVRLMCGARARTSFPHVLKEDTDLIIFAYRARNPDGKLCQKQPCGNARALNCSSNS
ncbi:ethylene-responsive transcription factor ERF003-like protein, partial [Tanacetum coccineum]